MTVGQLNTGIHYWRDFYVGRNVTVEGTLASFDILQILGGGPHFNSLLKETYLNETRSVIGVNLNWTEYSSLIGWPVIVKGVIVDIGRSVYIQADYVAMYLANAF